MIRNDAESPTVAESSSSIMVVLITLSSTKALSERIIPNVFIVIMVSSTLAESDTMTVGIILASSFMIPLSDNSMEINLDNSSLLVALSSMVLPNILVVDMVSSTKALSSNVSQPASAHSMYKKLN